MKIRIHDSGIKSPYHILSTCLVFRNIAVYYIPYSIYSTARFSQDNILVDQSVCSVYKEINFEVVKILAVEYLGR